MGFFSDFRAEFKVQSFVSRLEDANYKFRPDFLMETTSHLSAAKKPLQDLQNAQLEYKLTAVGWGYITKLCSELKAKLLRQGLDQMARDCDYIAEYATRMIGRSEQSLLENHDEASRPSHLIKIKVPLQRARERNQSGRRRAE